MHSTIKLSLARIPTMLIMNKPPDNSALATLVSLEDRLQRLEWYLSGSDEVEDTLQRVAEQGRDRTVQARLAGLESSLERLSAQSPTVNTLLQLRMSVPEV